MRRALERGLYRDEEVVLTVAGVDLLGKDLKPVAQHAEFPVNVVEAVFRILQQTASTGGTFPFTVREAAAVLKGQGEPRALQGYE